MTQVLVEPLNQHETINQEFVFNLRHRLNVKAIRPYFFVYGSPIGDFIFRLKRDSTVVVEKTFNAQDIKNALGTSDNYLRAIFNIEFDDPIVINYGEYELELDSSGYVFSESDYIGWVKMHEDLINTVNYTVINDWEYPYAFELWEYTR